MPPPKPRKQLAQAASAASKWAFGTEGLSKKQQAAAQKNYEYIEKRLRETGGGLTPAELGIGKKWRAKREEKAAIEQVLPLPKPRIGAPKPGDPEYSTSVGMGSAGARRALKAFSAPPRKRAGAILTELQRQGYARPTSEAQAQRQAKDLAKKVTATMEAAQKRVPPPPKVKEDGGWVGATSRGLGWAKEKTAGPADWLVPERAERAAEVAGMQTAGIAPDFFDAPMRNLKQVTGDIAMAFPAMGEVIYNDITGKTQWGIPKMLKEGLIQWGQGIERATPLPKDLRQTIEHIKKGEFDEIGKEAWQDLKDMRDEWTQRPFSALLNVGPPVATAFRAAEFPSLVRSIARANPNMSKADVLKAARKESYVPGYGAAKGKWKGGIPKRMLEGRLVSEEGEVLGAFKAPARPPSRSAAGRWGQAQFDRWSRSEGPLSPGRLPGWGRFTELNRAARALQRKNTLEWERTRTKLLQEMEPVEKYIRQSGIINKAALLGRLEENRARLAETFYGPQGPSEASIIDTLTAVSTDLKNLVREGGQEIPTDLLGKINKELRRVDLRLENHGLPVRLGTGLWAQAANMMRDAGYTQEQIEIDLELAAATARAWAKREPGRDPNDWLGSPEGRNIAGFEFGTPPAGALGKTLFQTLYPDDVEEVGALYPEGLQTPSLPSKAPKIKGMTPKLWKLIQQGAAYRDWYERGAAVIADMSDRTGISRAQVAAVVAITSQQANPTFNLRRAAEIIAEWKSPEGITPERYFPGQAAKVQHVLDSPDTFDWGGLKTNSYFSNFLEELDPAFYKRLYGEGQKVTVDRHIANMILGKKSVTPAQYKRIEDLFTETANELGWKPKEVQAAAWVPWKAQEMSISEVVKALGREMTKKGEIPEELRGKSGPIQKKRAAFIRAAYEEGRRPEGFEARGFERYLPAAADAYERGREQFRGVLYQRDAARVIQGAVQFLDGESGRQIIYLAEHADASTFVHELFGHAAHEMKRELPDEFAAVEKRYGKKLEDWTEAEHERLAREIERYFRTGKAPIDELQPVFDGIRLWMRTVYESIKALGKPINPETKALMDRYLGKEPLDFAPPKRLRRGLPNPGDLDAIATLVDETGDLLMHGPDVLRQDPARRLRIGGNMKWLEQQVLPFVDEMDSALAARVHDLFDQFDEVRSGSSVFNADERRLLAARGKLLRQRHGQLRKMENSLRAQPDRVMLDKARDVMDDLDNAETLEDIQASIKDLREVTGELDRRTGFDLESQRLLERQVKDLERAIDPTRKVDKSKRDEAIAVLRQISEEMTNMYIEIFGEGLSGESLEMLKRSLAVRDDLIPTRLRELGLLKEGTGSGTYMPHYSIFDKLFSTVRGPVRLPAAGRKRKQLSTRVRGGEMTFGKGANKLKRYGTGTLQVDPRALLSAYKNRIRFEETSLLRKQLYEIGVEIPRGADGNPRIPEGWYIINATGKAVPKRLERLAEMSQKEIDEMLASGEDIDSVLNTEKGTLEQLQEYKEAWLRKGEIPAEWDGDKLRMVPPEVVETLVGKVFESTPGGFLQSLGGLLAVGGRVSTIYAHAIGYLQANVAANAMLLALTNPTRAPRAVMEFFKTPLSLRREHPHLYQDIAVEAGDIMAEAGLPRFYVKEQTRMEAAERTATGAARGFAAGLGNLADQPFRVAAWTGHARKYGYTDPEGWKHLLTSDDPEVAHTRDIVSQRTREDMLDFNKLSPQEQRLARFLFIWPFIRAATAQPLWLMREYPGRMAALATAAPAQEQAYEDMGLESVRSRYNKVAPAAERSMFDIGQVPLAGGTVNMGAVNPVGPFAEKANEAYRFLQGDVKVVGDLLNPAFRTGGQQIFGDRDFDWKAIVETTVPGFSYYRAWTEPKKRGAQLYNDRSSFWDYIRRREGRFWPEDVSAEKIREEGKREAEELDKRPAWEKTHEEDLGNVDKITKAIAKKGGHMTAEELAPIKKSIAAYNALDQSEDKMKDELGKTELTEREKVEATERVLLEFWPNSQVLSDEQVERLPDTARGGKESKQGYRYYLRDQIQKERSDFFSFGRDIGAIKD